MNEVFERLRTMVAEQLGVDESRVVPSASFADDLEADSLDLVELIMSIEEEFGVEIADEDAERITTVGDAIAYLSTALPKTTQSSWTSSVRAQSKSTESSVLDQDKEYLQDE